MLAARGSIDTDSAEDGAGAAGPWPCMKVMKLLAAHGMTKGCIYQRFIETLEEEREYQEYSITSTLIPGHYTFRHHYHHRRRQSHRCRCQQQLSLSLLLYVVNGIVMIIAIMAKQCRSMQRCPVCWCMKQQQVHHVDKVVDVPVLKTREVPVPQKIVKWRAELPSRWTLREAVSLSFSGWGLSALLGWNDGFCCLAFLCHCPLSAIEPWPTCFHISKPSGGGLAPVTKDSPSAADSVSGESH